MQFSNIFKQLCNKKGITQKQALEEIGLARNANQKWKHGWPNGDTLKKIADYFGVTVDSLLRDDDSMQQSVGTAIGSNVIYGGVSGDASLSSNYSDNIAELNDMEAELLKIFRTLPPRGKHEFMGMIYEIEDKYSHPDLKQR